MKKVITVVASLLLVVLFATNNSFAQGVYDLRLAHQSLDCAKKKVVVSVEIKAVNADSAFKLEGANIRVRFATNQLKNPRFKSRDNFSGGMYEVMDSLISMTTDSTSGIFTVNIINSKGATDGTLVGATWIKMFALEFDVAAVNIDKCYSLTLMSTLPSSKVTKIVSSGIAAVVTKGTFTNITSQCAVKPVVALTATIGTGKPIELMLTLQAGDLPVTVTLSEGLSATMTMTTAKVAISPTVEMVYKITKIENQCAVGLSAANANSVTIKPAPSNSDPKPLPAECGTVTCIPITAKKIKL